MYELVKTKSFEKSYLKLQRSGKLTKQIETDLKKVINSLLCKKSLESKYKDHPLKGNFKKYRECHIRYDLLLVYEFIDKELILVLLDIGSHSEIFR